MTVLTEQNYICYLFSTYYVNSLLWVVNQVNINYSCYFICWLNAYVYYLQEVSSKLFLKSYIYDIQIYICAHYNPLLGLSVKYI